MTQLKLGTARSMGKLKDRKRSIPMREKPVYRSGKVGSAAWKVGSPVVESRFRGVKGPFRCGKGRFPCRGRSNPAREGSVPKP